MHASTTYWKPQPSLKTDILGKTVRGIRGTVGGDRVEYPGEVSAATAAMTTVKMLLNVCVTENADWITTDAKDFYLGTTSHI